ncbi:MULTISPECIES: hypothetical protein [unclassified Hyphomicrobium]|uniref:hypothetical protein n=1 Tax=unclassified Hyphomicrobium TaxID=2619925 RepID=UPI0002FCE30B|nr:MULTISPECIES: hypothetical protein [unclassified Hyphomicrobium]
MDDVSADLKMLQLRMAGMGAQLDGNWSKVLEAQRHLDRDTDECAYWHAGYHQALADVISLLSTSQANDDISDTSNLFRAVG